MRKQILIAAAYLSYYRLTTTKARLLLYDLPHATHEDEEVPLKRPCRQFVARQFF